MRLVDADALLLRAVPHGWSTPKWVSDIMIEDAPTIDAAPVKHAKLINPNPFGECSICRYLIDIRQDFRYCPNCGAKMDGEDGAI